MKVRLLAASALLALACTSCGHSEDEWQAQLSKYAQLQSDYDVQKRKVAELEAKLKQMGLELDSKASALNQANATLEEKERALAEFKARAKVLEEIRARFEMLRHKLDALTRIGLAVVIRHNRMVISLPGDVLFDTGKDTLKKDGEEVLGKVAAVIRQDRELAQRDYQVAGHTDNQPLSGGQFHDNWGLSLMRARSVLVYLVGAKGALPRQHWSAAGFGDTDPVASNATKEGQQKNRRCDIVVVPSIDEMLDITKLAH
ncbi:MAG TPA: OmpA family protein [Minicystis sp.]|nr:OmpA family protein [Minicystis sp.]